jgi:4-hydroxy-3-methylbut-2-enyl diphosphate reductase
VDLLLVVGARNSSNSNRLREIGETAGIPAYLLENADGLDPAWLDGVESVGISAGASAPEELVQELLERLRASYDIQLETLSGVHENVQFRLPESVSLRPAE